MLDRQAALQGGREIVSVGWRGRRSRGAGGGGELGDAFSYEVEA